MDHEWISVTDRLPEDNVGVLVTDGVEVTAAERFRFGSMPQGWGTHRVMGYDYELDLDGAVTHWMPLPPPPDSK